MIGFALIFNYYYYYYIVVVVAVHYYYYYYYYYYLIVEPNPLRVKLVPTTRKGGVFITFLFFTLCLISFNNSYFSTSYT